MVNGAIAVRRVSQAVACRIVRVIQRFGPRRVHVAGATFVVSPRVFNPRFFVTSELMARHLHVERDDVVLDVGTGSGVLAVVAARDSRSVVAIDINPDAVRCARDNARRNGVDVDVREGDLFEALRDDERFDVIVFNPPYMEGVARGPLGQALHDPHKSIATRFFAGARQHLAEGGHLRVLYSSIADPERLLAIASEHGWDHEVVAQQRTLFETYSIYRLTAATDRTTDAIRA